MERLGFNSDRQEWDAIVAREPRLPAQQLPTREVRWANEGRWVRIAAKVVVKTVHPGGRRHPHPTHVLK
eukprot:4212043-Pleurochrysis_carterae.AAC.1